jgi:hypothetical protein
MRLSARVAFVLMPLLAAGAAQAHIALDAPNARYPNSEGGPCGSGALSTAVNPPLTGGNSLTVMWHETINHGGHYRIGLSANEADFVTPGNLTIPAPPLPSWDLIDGFPDNDLAAPGTYMQTITLPDMDCPHCVLQVVQIASNNPDGSGGYYINYYACADLSITASGTTGVAGSGGGVAGNGGGGSGATGGGSGGVVGTGTGGHGGTSGQTGGGGTSGGGAAGAGMMGSGSGGCSFGGGGAPAGGASVVAASLLALFARRRSR